MAPTVMTSESPRSRTNPRPSLTSQIVFRVAMSLAMAPELVHSASTRPTTTPTASPPPEAPATASSWPMMSD